MNYKQRITYSWHLFQHLFRTYTPPSPLNQLFPQPKTLSTENITPTPRNQILCNIRQFSSTHSRRPKPEWHFCNIVRSVPHSGELVSVTNFAHQLWMSFGGWVWGLMDLQDTVTSPQEWHSDGTTSNLHYVSFHFLFNQLLKCIFWAIMCCSGNNVTTYNGFISGTAPRISAGSNFVYTQNTTRTPTVSTNKNTAIVRFLCR